MRDFELLAATAIALVMALPATAQTGMVTSAQNAAPTNGPGQEAPSSEPSGSGYAGDIVITAQRQSQRLQDVPIAVSAFTADNLEKQQIVNPLALQQSLPNVTFTKTNFASSSFTIRGIGDLCIGTTCDSATAVHFNDMPLLGSRLLDSEFFDLERIEVLRGPQGTLFGRNATSGVLNMITAKPDLSAIHAAGEFEYGNYDSKRVRAMVNLPITDTLGVRVAGTYLDRDGYTKNLYTGNNYDGRNIWSVRGSLSWEPTSDTRIDLIGQFTKEDDDRSRIQKQMCHRDPTGILGCSPDKRAFEVTNYNTTASALLTSNEFLGIAVGPSAAPFGLGSIYGTDSFATATNPTDMRTVNVAFEPNYYTEEEIYTAKIFHDFGSVSLNITGGYMRTKLDAQTGFSLANPTPYANNPGLAYLDAQGRPGGLFPGLNGVRQALIPNGAGGPICQSSSDPNGVGVYGGNAQGCFTQSIDFDRSFSRSRMYSAEAHIDSSFEGPFNFLLGGIYVDSKANDVDYYANSFGLDYATGLLGSLAEADTFSATPFFRSNTRDFTLKSYGIFGETYFEANDQLKLTIGLRYNHDEKFVRARTSLASTPTLPTDPLIPIGATSVFPAFANGTYDFDPAKPGNQVWAENSVAFSRLTGRAVLDYKISRDHLLYASYSRGYKSGGINPPLTPGFNVPISFAPESVNSFEIGSKNTFGGGALRLNVTGFYYKYKGLQLSRLVARTAVNDNVNADIYGVEAEAVISPTPALLINTNFSYLKTKVTNDKFLGNPRDPSGGRSDAVIIKDITTAANCAVVQNAGNGALANAFVDGFNAAVGLRGTQPVPGTSANGAFSICSALADAAAAGGAALGGISVLGSGVEVNIRNNQLPNAPTFKWSAGVQYTFDFGGSGFTLVPRADINFTGNAWGTVFNKNPIDRIPAYEVLNAQVQLNAPDDRFYLRGFVQNLTANNAITGIYAADQSAGAYTNVFTIEPRRYGVAAGFKF